MPKATPDPALTRAAVLTVKSWIDDPEGAPMPPRSQLADAVRRTARTLEHIAPGHSVEVRVPPFVAIQCIDGPWHTRGTPPNVVETNPLTWLQLATGKISLDQAISDGKVDASGTRAREIEHWLPLV